MIIREETIGDIRLIQGDCLEVMKGLPVADHVICDPPYEGLLHEQSKKLSTGGQLKDKRNPFNEFDFQSVDEIRKPFIQAIKSNGWLIAFCTAEGVARWADEINESELKYKRPCLWIKPDGMPQFNGQMPGMGYECFITAWCGEGHSKWNGGGKHGIYTFPKDSSSKTSVSKDEEGKPITHPTEKPIKLMEALVRDFTNHGQLILDPFAGSGSTLVACAKMGRKGIGIELDPKYFDIAVARVKQAYEQPDLFLGPPAKPVQDSLI